MIKHNSKSEREKLVKKHIDSLFPLVKKNRFTNSAIADRYIFLIRRIAMKTNHKLDSEIKRSYCKHCKELFIPGKNSRVRVHKKRVIYYCFNCKKYTRIPYSKKH